MEYRKDNASAEAFQHGQLISFLILCLPQALLQKKIDRLKKQTQGSSSKNSLNTWWRDYFRRFKGKPARLKAKFELKRKVN